jgi:hypothetical protein
MRHARFLIIPLVMLFILACGLTNGIQQATTQIPNILNSAPTALGSVETAAAGVQATSNCPSTPAAAGLGLGLGKTKSVLEMTQKFTFTDSTVNGQPVSTATLASGGASTFSSIASGFSAQFIGDPCNLSQITVTIPRTDQTVTDQAVEVANILLTGVLPPDVQLALVAWLTQNYSSIPVGGQQQTTIRNLQFTLQRNQTSMILTVLPAK